MHYHSKGKFVFERSILSSPWLSLLDQKYSKISCITICKKK